MKQAPSYLSVIGFLFGLYMGNQMLPGSNLTSGNVQTCFTPGEDCTGLIVQQLDAAKQEIRVQSYSFTSVPIAQALVRAHKRGVKVSILLDKSNRDKMEKMEALQMVNAIPHAVKFDVLPGIAHNKIMLIDGVLITGSFNFTKAAQFRNAENILVIRNEEIYSKYKANWESRNKVSFNMTALPLPEKKPANHHGRESRKQDNPKQYVQGDNVNHSISTDIQQFRTLNFAR